MKVRTRLDIACQKWIWLLKTNELMECMNILSPVDDVINVNNVNKGESVSYPQVVRNFGDNYIHVINYIFSSL